MVAAWSAACLAPSRKAALPPSSKLPSHSFTWLGWMPWRAATAFRVSVSRSASLATRTLKSAEKLRRPLLDRAVENLLLMCRMDSNSL